MSTVVLIVGIVLIVAGLIEILRAGSPSPPREMKQTQEEGFLSDLKEVLEQMTKFLGQFPQRFRIGVLLLTLGVGLVGLAAYIHLNDKVNNSQKTSSVAGSLYDN